MRPIDVAGLHGRHAESFVEREGIVELSFVVGHRAAGFVVADEVDAFRLGVVGELGEIEIGIRFGEAELVAVLDPVAVPTLVPAFDQHAVEAVLGGEVDVALGVGGGGAVLVAGAPGRFVEMHLPPDADVLAGLDPAGVLELARLVEVENQVRT